MEKKSSRIRPVSQEHTMGCAVACVASLCSLSYKKALKLFQNKDHAWTRGYYCPEIVEALERAGHDYSYDEFDSKKHHRYLRLPGTIIFISPCAEYPLGHFLLRGELGWMNPWLNFPLMVPVQSGFQRKLPGEISYLLFPNQSLTD